MAVNFLLVNQNKNGGWGEDFSSCYNKAYAIKEAIEVGRSRFNFLKGSERYKYELGGIDTPIHNILISKK